MRLRAIVAAAVAVAALTCLAGCRTNVGVAGTVDGSQVSESRVGGYLTSSAKPVSISEADGSHTAIPPRSFVLDILIQQAYFAKVLAAVPGGSPSDGQLQTLHRQLLGTASDDSYATKNGVRGYADSFESVLVDSQVLATLLRNDVTQGTDVNKIAAKVSFPVKVNPRYGSWDQKMLQLSTGASAGVPQFLHLQPTTTNGS